MNRKKLLTGIMLVAALIVSVPIIATAGLERSNPVQEAGQELLKNPGFEGISCRAGSEPGWCLDNWTHDVHYSSFHDNIFTPQGWVSWWRKGGDYGQPEVKTIPRIEPFTGEIERIRSGNYAVLLFTFFRLQDVGLYQVVHGLEPGATVQFSAYAHGWSCDNDEPMGYTCGDPWNQTFQVGIAPDGAPDPFSPNIVWSSPQQSPDTYRLIGPITAQVGEGGSVCVFLRSKTKWATKYQDAYWDDASLVVTSPGVPPTDTPQPPPPTPTYGPSPTPLATPTPRPDGATVHIVQSGDTLSAIAVRYNKTVDQIRALNATSLGANNLIVPGQELVIALPDNQATPTTLPVSPTVAPTEAAVSENPEQPANPAGGATICVLAYHDRNGNMYRDDPTTEEVVANAEFTVAGPTGIVAQHVSDHSPDPYCFTGLTPGAYRVIMTPPDGYEPSGQAEWPVAVAEGTRLDVQFGNVQIEGTETITESEEIPSPVEGNQEESSNVSRTGRVIATLAKAGGILVLLLAGAIAVFFAFNRQRMF
ncbi:MAG TPA: LysM peptidoglycan-binding domain-containing protein [Chloroflexi bacterium]|nr:LysM peptidoglycan-binding domain-containing protein [Chloroflexota bacterium]